MKNTLYLLTIASLLIFGCKSNKNVANNQNIDSEKTPVRVEVLIGETANFEIINVSGKVIALRQPARLKIEKLENGNWVGLKILPCPCDAPCNLEKEISISPGETFLAIWNKKESWCGTERVENIRNTIYKQAEKGTYRIKIEFLKDGGSIETLYQNFEIN